MKMGAAVAPPLQPEICVHWIAALVLFKTRRQLNRSMIDDTRYEIKPAEMASTSRRCCGTNLVIMGNRKKRATPISMLVMIFFMWNRLTASLEFIRDPFIAYEACIYRAYR